MSIKSGRSPQDPDADWTKKGGKYHFTYKAHVGIGQESELVRKISMTPAHVHDENMLESALSGDEDWAFADQAYDSKKNQKILESKGISNGILIKGTRKGALTAVEKRCNRILSRFRSPLEQVFGTLKRSYRYCKAKYLGLRKNKLQLTITSMAYNLRRMEKLCA